MKNTVLKGDLDDIIKRTTSLLEKTDNETAKDELAIISANAKASERTIGAIEELVHDKLAFIMIAANMSRYIRNEDALRHLLETIAEMARLAINNMWPSGEYGNKVDAPNYDDKDDDNHVF